MRCQAMSANERHCDFTETDAQYHRTAIAPNQPHLHTNSLRLKRGTPLLQHRSLDTHLGVNHFFYCSDAASTIQRLIPTAAMCWQVHGQHSVSVLHQCCRRRCVRAARASGIVQQKDQRSV